MLQVAGAKSYTHMVIALERYYGPLAARVQALGVEVSAVGKVELSNPCGRCAFLKAAWERLHIVWNWCVCVVGGCGGGGGLRLSGLTLTSQPWNCAGGDGAGGRGVQRVAQVAPARGHGCGPSHDPAPGLG